jgi:2'-5' RNA ligase
MNVKALASSASALSLVVGSVWTQRCLAAESPALADSDRVVAIDVLLEPDATMVKRAIAANAELRANYPQGYTLGPEQVPHISLVQRYVKAGDLDEVGAAVSAVLAKENPRKLQLTATGYAYAPWAGVSITGIAVERTPELNRLQANIEKAVEPFAVPTGTVAAFSTSKDLPDVEEAIVDYVKTFVPKSSGDKYSPHVTIGVGREAFVKQLKSEPFEKFAFKPVGVAIYHLGGFGTAQKKLWQWKPAPAQAAR